MRGAKTGRTGHDRTFDLATLVSGRFVGNPGLAGRHVKFVSHIRKHFPNSAHVSTCFSAYHVSLAWESLGSLGGLLHRVIWNAYNAYITAAITTRSQFDLLLSVAG